MAYVPPKDRKDGALARAEKKNVSGEQRKSARGNDRKATNRRSTQQKTGRISDPATATFIASI